MLCLLSVELKYNCICHDSVVSCYSNMKWFIFIILGHIDMPMFFVMALISLGVIQDTGHPVHIVEHLASSQSTLSFDLCRQLKMIT